MSTATALKAPVGLSPRARSLWAAVQRDYQLEEHHQALLVEACRTLTRLDAVTKALDAAPAVTTGSTGQLRGNPCPWYQGLPGYGDPDPVVGLYLHGPGLDLGDHELRVMTSAWPDYEFRVRQERRRRGCPHLDRPGGTPYHDVAKGQCPSWWEETARRREVSGGHRRQPA